MATRNNIRVEHAVLVFRNFAGAQKMYNDKGKRNFCVYLDGYDRKGHEFEDPDMIPKYKYGPDYLGPNELIPALQKDGWNVKWTKESDDGEYPSRPYIKVNVKYSEDWPQFNPKVLMVKRDGGLTSVDEDTIHMLDTTWISNADLIIKPNNYEERKGIADGKVSADLKMMYITPVEDADEDDFDGKYSSASYTAGDGEPLPF